MPSILTFRRGTAAQNNAFTGSAGEISVDTTNGTLRVHDGVTTGGSQLATSSTLGALATLDTVDTAQIDDAAITAAKLAPGAAGGLKSQQVFTSSGTWTKPAGVTKVKVIVTGGGGGGAGGDGGTNTGDGGGAGATSIKIIDVSAISSVSVTVGSAGNGGASQSASGGSGGTSSFGSHCSAGGGSGGVQWNTSNRGGFGGTASGGDINITGGDGEQASPHDAADDGPGAHGGASYWGGGGKGAQSYSYEKAARPGQAYGSGGASGLHTGGTSFPGAAGKHGIVVVEEYA
jgi:hypothetical protein